MRLIRFAHPDPLTDRKQYGPQMRPVFLPFAGCPHRCAFCGQHLQTGQTAQPLETHYESLRAHLEQVALNASTRTLELAFYGGTFTALPEPWPERFLKLAALHRASGLVVRVRCSTRPDHTDPAMLARLKGLGLDMVELGIQSFDSAALRASGRGYDSETALQGCENVRVAGLDLGVQLMPGLPGDQPGTFQRDVARTLALQPEAVRLYPCLVIDGTLLARQWREKTYRPWSLARTRQELAAALGALWSRNIPVIRIGLHPEPDLLPAILDGPWHPALGQMVRSLALFDHVRARAANLGPGPNILFAPRRFSGEVMGHGAELRQAWRKAGITIQQHDGQRFGILSK
ncbi:MAG: radical SAM protein [Desulfovibrionaceae bacterium]